MVFVNECKFRLVHFVLNLAGSALKKSTVKKLLLVISTLVILPLYNLRPNLLRVILALHLPRILARALGKQTSSIFNPAIPQLRPMTNSRKTILKFTLKNAEN